MNKVFFIKYRLLPALVLYILLLVTRLRFHVTNEVPKYNNVTNVSDAKEPHQMNDSIKGAQECKIHDISHWDPSIALYVTPAKLTPCVWSAKLTYAEGGQWLVVNETIRDKVYEENLTCQFCAVRRKEHDDDHFVLGPWAPLNLTNRVRVQDGFIKVSCSVGKNLIYTNYHTFLLDQESAIKRIAAHNNTKNKGIGVKERKDQWNVLLIGTDSLSRGAAIRYLVRTRKFLLNELNATEMLGYTKVGENTYNNMVPFYTGWHKNEIERVPKQSLDYLPLIYKNYTAAGYTTFFGEDMPWGTTFNYLLKGFREPPTDYYYHPLALSVKKDERQLSWKGCERDGITNKIIMDYLKQFVIKFKNERFFTHTYHSELSHDNTLLVWRLDEMYVEVLRYFKQVGVFNNTFVFTFGDHGPRYGSIVKTTIDNLESRIPFMSITVPEAFAAKHPHYVKNLRINSRRLTTHFDTYRTMLDILDQANHVENPVFPKGRSLSLFPEIPRTRTCATAGVPLIFCACYTEKTVNLTSKYVKAAAIFLVNEINKLLLHSSSICEKLKLEKTVSVIMYYGHNKKGSDSLGMIYKLRFFTTPGNGEFIGTVHILKEGAVKNMHHIFLRKGKISRVNRYGSASICVQDRELRLYCYCKSQIGSINAKPSTTTKTTTPTQSMTTKSQTTQSKTTTPIKITTQSVPMHIIPATTQSAPRKSLITKSTLRTNTNTSEFVPITKTTAASTKSMPRKSFTTQATPKRTRNMRTESPITAKIKTATPTSQTSGTMIHITTGITKQHSKTQKNSL